MQTPFEHVHNFPRFLQQSANQYLSSIKPRGIGLVVEASISIMSLQSLKSAFSETVNFSKFSEGIVRKMRLLTHNMLKSHVKGVKNGYPLAIEVQMLYFLCKWDCSIVLIFTIIHYSLLHVQLSDLSNIDRWIHLYDRCLVPQAISAGWYFVCVRYRSLGLHVIVYRFFWEISVFFTLEIKTPRRVLINNFRL